MTDKIFVRRPKLGDYVCKRVSDRKVFYLDWENPDCPEGNLFTVGEEQYEKIGSAVPYEGDKAICLWRETASKTWCDRYRHALGGYVLDGEEHVSTLSIRTDASWTSAVDYDFTYSAGSVEELAQQLNDYFASTEVFNGENQDWVALVEDGNVVLDFKFVNANQHYNAGKNGFSLSACLMPDVKSLAKMRRRNGFVGSEGAISSFHRALAYFRNDNTSATYNPSAVVANVKRQYPICLPAYLGTSAHRDDQCAFLRSVYGEGEDGWLRFMASCLTVDGERFGNFGQGFEYAKKTTASLAAKTYSSQSKTDEPMCKAAKYCYDTESATVDKGEFALPPVGFISAFLARVKYPAPTNSRTADALNASRLKAGWTAIGNGTYFWSCSRNGANFAWCASGNIGFFYSNGMCNSGVCVPASLYRCDSSLNL